MSQTNFYAVKTVTAAAGAAQRSAWCDIRIIEKRGQEYSENVVTLFFDTAAEAQAYAEAINSANASPAVQAAHERRHSDAGIQEYRNLITEIA